MKPTYEELQQQLENAKREFRSADITMQNLEAKCAALAAENAVLLAVMNEQAGCLSAALTEGFHEAVMGSGVDQLIDIYQRRLQPAIQCIPPTPATDAFLAEVRASAIDSIVDIKTKQLEDMHPDTHAFGATAMSIRSQINELQAFAAQLRKGDAQ